MDRYSTDAALDAALSADADKLTAMGADPGPTLADLGLYPGTAIVLDAPKAQPTPGPWSVRYEPKVCSSILIDGPGSPALASIEICDHDDGQGERVDEVDFANAKLISAAPLMRDALREARAIIAHASDGCEDLLATIDAALDAAEGR